MADLSLSLSLSLCVCQLPATLCTLSCNALIMEVRWSEFILFIAELEGEATNLDAQVAERLYIYVYFSCVYTVSQLWTPRSWP